MTPSLSRPYHAQRWLRAHTLATTALRPKRFPPSLCTCHCTTRSLLTATATCNLSFLHRSRPVSSLHKLHSAHITLGRYTPASNTTSASATAFARSFTTTAPSTPTTASPLALVYKHDRSSYYRRLTIASAASLCLVWLPLAYFSIAVATPPLYPTLLGPLATVATLVATHFRARRVIHTLHRAPAGLLVHTYTALGQPHRIGMVGYGDVRPQTSGSGSGGGSTAAKGYWIVQLAGYKRYFLIDKQGDVVDRDVMRRLVGTEELETEEEQARRLQQGVRGPGTLGRLQRKR